LSYELFAGNWPLAVAVPKHIFLAATYWLVFDTGRRISGNVVTGALAAAGLLFLPQIVWLAQITLSHSALLMMAAAAVLHAIVLIYERPTRTRFVWLGIAAGIGALAKYNAFVLYLALAVGSAFVAPMRTALFRRELLLSLGVFLALFGPHAYWMLENWYFAVARASRLYVPDKMHRFDVSFVGLDGFLSLCVAILAWAGPLLIVWAGLYQVGKRQTRTNGIENPATTAVFARLLGLTMLIGIAGFAIGMLIIDGHSVRERYLTPFMMPLSLWLALRFPITHSTPMVRRFFSLSIAIMIVVTIAWPQLAILGEHKFAYPYRAFADDIRPLIDGPVEIAAYRREIAANLAIRLPGTEIHDGGRSGRTLILVWEQVPAGEAWHAAFRAKNRSAYRPVGDIRKFTRRYDYFSGKIVRLSAQILIPAGAPVN
jgi:4-amino-4-deoxy-L-arabinose transferase-like glycosyltransferase